MKETLVRDPKGLNRHQGLPAREADKVCRTANFAKRPLGSVPYTLAALREALLPKLMRGEVRVK